MNRSVRAVDNDLRKMTAMLFALVLCTIIGASSGKFSLATGPRDGRFPEIWNFRLLNDTKPIRYEIWFTPDFEDFTFNGDIEITIVVQEETDVITLHSNGLMLESYQLRREHDILDITQATYEEDFYFQHFHLAEPVQPDDILKLSITYRGIIQTPNRGFYRAPFSEGEDTK